MKLEKSLRMRLRDVLVLTLAEVSDEEEPELNALAANLSNVCNIPIIILREGMTLDTLAEADMLRAGWMRMERSPDARNNHSTVADAR